MKYIEVKDYKNFSALAIVNDLSVPLRFTKSILSLNTSQVNIRTLKAIISGEEWDYDS